MFQAFKIANCIIPYTRPGPPLSFQLHDKEEDKIAGQKGQKTYKATKIKPKSNLPVSVTSDEMSKGKPLIGPSLPASDFNKDHTSDGDCDNEDLSSYNLELCDKSSEDVKAENKSSDEKTEDQKVKSEEQSVMDVSQQLSDVKVNEKRGHSPTDTADEPPDKKAKIEQTEGEKQGE